MIPITPIYRLFSVLKGGVNRGKEMVGKSIVSFLVEFILSPLTPQG